MSGLRVGAEEKNTGRTSFVDEAAGTEINDFYSGRTVGHEQDVLWLEVAVDDLEPIEEVEAAEQLPTEPARVPSKGCRATGANGVRRRGSLPDSLNGAVRLHSGNVVAQEAVALDALVEVHAQQLKDDAQVVPEDKVATHAHHVAAVVGVLRI